MNVAENDGPPQLSDALLWLLEISGKEYMVRGRGYVGSIADLERIVLKTDEQGTPVLVRDVGSVALGPEIRRGVSDLDGRGDVVGTIKINA